MTKIKMDLKVEFHGSLVLLTLLLWIRSGTAQRLRGTVAGPPTRPQTNQLEILDVAENLVGQMENIFQENNHLRAMKDQHESQTQDQRSRLSFLFQDLRGVISDIRHLRKAATFGRICTSTDTGTRMHRLHNNLINSMNEKVERLGDQIQVLNEMEAEFVTSHVGEGGGGQGVGAGGPRQQYAQQRIETPTTTPPTTTTTTTTPAPTTSQEEREGDGRTTQPTPSPTPEFNYQQYCQEHGAAERGVAVFCVSDPGETEDKMDPVPFGSIDVNIGSIYRNTTSRLTNHPGGIFYMSVSYATFRNHPVTIATRNIKKDVALSYWSTKAQGFNPVSISKDLVQWIAPAKRPYVTREAVTKDGIARDNIVVDRDDSPVARDASGGHFRSPFLTWLGFRLSGQMRPLVAFSAALSPTYFRENGVVRFPYVLQNAGFAYSRNTSSFQAPVDGVYHFTVSVTVEAESQAKIRLRVNGKERVELLQTSANHNGANTVTRTTLLELKVKDEVDVVLVGPPGAVLYSDRGLQTSFSGFLYAPSRGYQVAWSAHRSHSWLSTDPNQALDPVDFDAVLVDRHADFNAATGTFTCATPGVYYVHVNMAAFPGRKLYASLVVNSRARGTQVVENMSLLRFSIRENGIDTISAATLVQLAEGDSLYVRTSPGDAFYGDSHMQTSFSGLLVKPTC